MPSWMIGVDTGGTFTDMIAVETETHETKIAKVPSAPADPSLAVMAALEELIAQDIAPADIVFIAHGTTVATNALLEGKGAPTGLIITRGFRAVYEARGTSQPSGANLIDPFYVKPPMLVPQRHTEEITGRINAKGEIITALDEGEARRAVQRLKAKGIASIAVCFLFSFLNNAHERRVAEIIAEEAPDMRVSLSSQVLPVVREYVRLSTTVVDAYVGPAVESYIRRLVERLRVRGIATPQLFMMQSNGGLVRMQAGARFASQLLLSGPAAGLIAAAELGNVTGYPNVVAFDMGGTSTDIGVVTDGYAGEASGGVLAGQDIGVPMLKIRTLGAGGGTIAWLDRDGLLKVGPHSAGAAPGPAAYGRGGNRPTVTDANVVLGALGGASLAGGLLLDRAAAERAMLSIAEPLGLDLVTTAEGIIRIINNKMAVDLRLGLQERGQDPRRFALIAFGGAGGLHACDVARMVGLPRVLVPMRPGLACATGLLQTAVRHQYLRSCLRRLGTVSVDEVNALLAGLYTHAAFDAEAEGFAATALRLVPKAEMRYLHQGYQLAVPCPYPLEDGQRATLKHAFDEIHRRTYGNAAETEDAEIVTLRLDAEIEVPRLRLAPLGVTPPSPRGLGTGDDDRTRHLWNHATHRFEPARVIDRGALAPTDHLDGPAIITQYDATTVLPAGQHLTVDRYGTLIIETGAPGA